MKRLVGIDPEQLLIFDSEKMGVGEYEDLYHISMDWFTGGSVEHQLTGFPVIGTNLTG